MLTSATPAKELWTAPIAWVGSPGSSTHPSHRFDPGSSYVSIVISVLDLAALLAAVVRGAGHAGRAHQGHGAGSRRAYQSAGRLRIGGGLERHGRPNQPGALYGAVAHQYVGPARCDGAGQRHTAIEKCR